MIDYVQARRLMVDTQIKTSGITDRRLLTAMGRVPREQFVPEERRDLAYVDLPHRFPAPTGARYLGAPAPFAKLVQLAEIRADDRVLDVGCASGYSAAVLAELAGRVVAVESEPGLAAMARDRLRALGAGNVEVVTGPLLGGAAEKGPYDAIMVEGALDEPPETLFGQLGQGGRLVCLVREGRSSTAHLYTRSESDVAGTRWFNTTLPPLISAPREDVFVF